MKFMRFGLVGNAIKPFRLRECRESGIFIFSLGALIVRRDYLNAGADINMIIMSIKNKNCVFKSINIIKTNSN